MSTNSNYYKMKLITVKEISMVEMMIFLWLEMTMNIILDGR